MSGSTTGQSTQLSSIHESIGSSGGPQLKPGQEDDVVEEKAFGTAIMGVMYTVCKEKNRYSWFFIGARLLADWLQLWLIVVNPVWFAIQGDALWWRIVSFVQLNDFMSARGYTFFLACFYLLIFGLIVSIAISIWVGKSFQNNRFNYVWPIVFLRWFANIFYQMLDIMSLTLFLMALDCQYFSRPAEHLFYNQEFPDVYCFTMPHIVHAFAAAIAIVVFAVLAAAFSMGEMELNFTTRNVLAIMHTGAELEAFILRFLMACVSVFVVSLKWMSVAELVLACRLVWVMLWWQPQVYGWVNHVRVGMYTSVAWCSVLFVLAAFQLGANPDDQDSLDGQKAALTYAMWATFVPMGLLGAWVSHLRLKFFTGKSLRRFKSAAPTDLPHEVFEFTDSRQAEILARCCRVWVSRDALDQQFVHLAEAVIKCALLQLPKDPYIIVLHSSFLIDVQGSYQSGYTALQAAKKLDPTFLMRYAIFTREQQHTQKSADGAGGKSSSRAAATDLVSYVEFQRNYSLALKVHREALLAMRGFWETLMHNQVPFRTLARCIKTMDVSIRTADRVYKQVLSRHASHVKIVRLYAKFLEHVKHDPWAASKWFAEAEKLEAAEEEGRNNDVWAGMEADDPELQAALIRAGALSGDAAEEHCIIIINSLGIIQMTNKVAHQLFGYTKTELRGKNISILLPPIIAEQHTGYIRSYISTGRTNIMGRTSEQVAVHKDRYLVPVQLNVSKLSGVGEDTLFIGIMEQLMPEPDTATVWVLRDGTILSAGPVFTDWFAFTAKEVEGKPLSSLVASDGLHLDRALASARAAAAVTDQSTQNKDGLGLRTRSVTSGSIVGSAARHGSGTYPVAGMQAVAEATLEEGETDMALIAADEGEDGTTGLATLPAPTGRARRHRRSRKERAALPEVEDSQPYLAPGDSYKAPASPAGNTAGSFKEQGGDVEAGLNPRPPSVGKQASNADGSPRPVGGHNSLHALQPYSAPPAVYEVQQKHDASFGVSVTAVTAAAGPVPADPARKACWVVRGVFLTHKYTDPAEVDITITNAGAGALRLQRLILRMAPKRTDPMAAAGALLAPSASLKQFGRLGSLPGIHPRLARSRRPSALAMQMGLVPGGGPYPEPIPQELMLVANGNGTVVHVTQKLAALLGRTVQQVLANSTAHALEQLMVEPFSQLHRTLAASIPQTAPPAHSCRSGVSFLMSELSAQGRTRAAPFRMSLKRQMLGDEALHVMCFEKRTLEQAMDERRLLLEVNTQGIVQAILSTSTPGSLFGFEPHQLMGKSLGNVVDVLHLQGKGADAAEEEALLAGTQGSLLAQVLLELAAQSMEHAGISWRVGVSPPLDVAAGSRVGLPHRKHTRPAVMRLQVLDMGQDDDAGEGQVLKAKDDGDSGNSGLILLVELWRSDLVTSVVELDSEGNVMSSADHQATLMELYPAGLLLGVGSELMVEYHISAFLPQLGDRPVSDLFTADTFGPAPAQAGTRRLADPSKRSNMKRANQHARGGVARAGPLQVLKLQHSADEMPLEVVVQAVRKNGSGYYLVMHPLHPAAGRPDFVPWVLGKQHMSLLDIPSPAKESQSKSTNPAVPGHPARHLLSAMSLRQMSRDLGATPSAPKQMRPPQQAVLSALANLGLPTPAVTGGKPGSGARRGAALEQAEPGDESGSCSTGSSEEEEEEEASGDSLADSAKHPRLQMSHHLSGLASPKAVNGGQAKAVDAAHPQAAGYPLKGAQSEGRVAEWVATSPPGNQRLSGAVTNGQPYGGPRARHSSGGVSSGNDGNRETSDTEHDDDQQDAPLDSDREADAARLDDAEATGDGISDQDFTRGKRFRKLHRVLVSTVIQRPINRLRKAATAIAASLALVHLGMFVLIYTLLNQQTALVNDLGLMGKAVVLATEMSVSVRTLRYLFSNIYAPGLQLMSGPADIPYQLELLKGQLEQFLVLHTGAYLGYTKQRRMPDTYGLRSLWEDALLQGTDIVAVPANETFGNYTTVATLSVPTNYSLYTAGNMLAKCADIFHEQIHAFNASLPPLKDGSIDGATLSAWPPNKWISDNVANTVITPYMTSMNTYLELVLDTAVTVNNVQLMLLAIEGVGLCVIAMVWMWLLLQRVAAQRYSMLCVFMIVPSSLVRRLALRKLRLTDEEDEDDDNDNLAIAAAKGGKHINDKAGARDQGRDHDMATAAEEARAGKRELAAQPSVTKLSKHGGSVVISGGAADKDVEAGIVSSDDVKIPAQTNMQSASAFMSKILLVFGLGRGNWNVGNNPQLTAARKRLLPSYAATVWLIWPFLAWGCLIMVCYAVGYTLLGLVNEPICLFNIVNYMAANFKYNLFLTQKIASTTTVAQAVVNRNHLYQLNQGLKVDYTIMLYGMGAALNSTPTASQFNYIKKGVAYSGTMGDDIMFNYRGCMCYNTSQCWPENSTMYALTNNGLDRMVQHFFQFCDSLPTFRGADPDMAGQEFGQVWNMIPDMTDGFSRLSTAYQDFVTQNMNSVLGLHTAVFVLSLALMVGYIFVLLRPFLAETANETRRIAELLSQLPAEMDVDTMMAKTLLADMGLMGPGQQQQGKGALTADGLRQVAAASSGKVQPTAAMTKTISMQ